MILISENTIENLEIFRKKKLWGTGVRAEYPRGKALVKDRDLIHVLRVTDTSYKR